MTRPLSTSLSRLLVALGLLLAGYGGLLPPFAVAAETIPDGLLYYGVEGDTVIAVDKSGCTLYVYQLNGHWRLRSLHSCESGKVDGDKQVEGDQKTPEGIYRFRQKLSSSLLDQRYGEKIASVYGSGALVTNYPNFLDRYFHHKTGSGIWLHGTESVEPVATRGCISLRNDELLEVKQLVSLRNTPMLISKKLQLESPWKVLQERQQVLEFLQTWITSWETSDNPVYLSLYSDDFRTQKFNATRWKQYKQNVNDLYREKRISIQVLSILRSADITEVRLFQDYDAPHLQTSGLKTLYLRKKESGYEIVSEQWGKLNAADQLAMERQSFPIVLNGTPIEGSVVKATPENDPLLAALSFSPNLPDEPATAEASLPEEPETSAEEPLALQNPEGLSELRRTLISAPAPVELDALPSGAAWLVTTDAEPEPPPASPVDLDGASATAAAWVTTADADPAAPNTELLATADHDNAESDGVAWLDTSENTPAPEAAFSFDLTFEHAPEAPAPAVAPAPAIESTPEPLAGAAPAASKDPLQSVLSFVNHWRTLWEGEDVSAYLQMYAEDFRSEDYDRAAWADLKQRVAERNGARQVQLTPLQIEFSGEDIRVRLLQDYQSERLSDLGTKTLILRRAGSRFEIVRETWEALTPAAYDALLQQANVMAF